MPIIKSAIKRVKQASRRRERNISIKKDIKSATKSCLLYTSPSPRDRRRKASLSRIAKQAGVKLESKKTVSAK